MTVSIFASCWSCRWQLHGQPGNARIVRMAVLAKRRVRRHAVSCKAFAVLRQPAECSYENLSPASLLVLTAIRVVGLSRSFILQACLRTYFAKFVHFDHEIDGSTTDFAVFDVFLGLDRTIDQQDETFPAIGALDPVSITWLIIAAGRYAQDAPAVGGKIYPAIGTLNDALECVPANPRAGVLLRLLRRQPTG